MYLFWNGVKRDMADFKIDCDWKNLAEKTDWRKRVVESHKFCDEEWVEKTKTALSDRFISIIIWRFAAAQKWREMEEYHYPGRFTSTLSPFVNGTQTEISSIWDTPDYRMEEPMFLPRYSNEPREEERPYRNSPPYKQSRTFGGFYWPRMEVSLGCYCCTVYRRHILLGGCAVITTRHVVTSANPTVLMLRSYGHLANLEGIVGGWYDTNENLYNTSYYFTPCRIHIHPNYRYDYELNVSHPIPAMYDLSVWAATHTFVGGYFKASAIVCQRPASGWFEYASTIPRQNDMSIVAGFQFIKAYKRRPLPWFRYIVKTRKHVWPCPKSDWHWFHCIMGEYWAKYGFDSGGGMNSGYLGADWRVEGFAGMCSFSMKLRAMQLTHYFTVVDTYPVLDFMYDAFLGLKPPTYLDYRFEDSKWCAPVLYWGEYIPYYLDYAEQVYSEYGLYKY